MFSIQISTCERSCLFTVLHHYNYCIPRLRTNIGFYIHAYTHTYINIYIIVVAVVLWYINFHTDTGIEMWKNGIVFTRANEWFRRIITFYTFMILPEYYDNNVKIMFPRVLHGVFLNFPPSPKRMFFLLLNLHLVKLSTYRDNSKNNLTVRDK